jgi:hypothetical protein
MILLNSFMGLFSGFKALYIGYGNTAAQYTYIALMRMLISPLSLFPLLLCHTVYQSRCDDFSGSKQCCFVMALGNRPKEAAFSYSVIVLYFGVFRCHHGGPRTLLPNITSTKCERRLTSFMYFYRVLPSASLMALL